jgi:hypothetical protein
LKVAVSDFRGYVWVDDDERDLVALAALSSSNVMMTVSRPDVLPGPAITLGIHAPSQLSAAARLQSWASLHRFGVTSPVTGSDPALMSLSRLPPLAVSPGDTASHFAWISSLGPAHMQAAKDSVPLYRQYKGYAQTDLGHPSVEPLLLTNWGPGGQPWD